MSDRPYSVENNLIKMAELLKVVGFGEERSNVISKHN